MKILRWQLVAAGHPLDDLQASDAIFQKLRVPSGPRWIAWFDAGGRSAVDDLIDGMRELFGLAWNETALRDFLRQRGTYVWPGEQLYEHLTFAELAAFIAERAKRTISFEPLEVAGVVCSRAGAFRGLEQLVARRQSCDRSIAPSTPIDECFRGFALNAFWYELEQRTIGRVPALKPSWSAFC